MSTATVYRAGKAVRAVTLDSSQSAKYTTLAAALGIAGGMTKDWTNGNDVYSLLTRLDELLDQTRTPAKARDEAVFVPPTFTPKAVELRKTFPAGDYRSQAESLGLLPLDGLPFDHSELTDPPPAGGVCSGVVVGGSSVPQMRAFVRYMP